MTPATSREPGARQNGAADTVDTVSGARNAARASASPSPGDVRRACFARYLRATRFALDRVRPTYEAAGVPCTDATVAAIAATLFLGLCRAGGVTTANTWERPRECGR